MLEVAVGFRQLSLRSLDCGCDPGDPAQFSGRRLWVVPMLTTAWARLIAHAVGSGTDDQIRD